MKIRVFFDKDMDVNMKSVRIVICETLATLNSLNSELAKCPTTMPRLSSSVKQTRHHPSSCHDDRSCADYQQSQQVSKEATLSNVPVPSFDWPYFLDEDLVLRRTEATPLAVGVRAH